MANVVWKVLDSMIGRKLVATNDNATLTDMPQDEQTAKHCPEGSWVILTGAYYYYPGDVKNAWFQITVGDWFVHMDMTNGTTQYWKNVGNIDLPHFSRDDVQKYVDAMIKNNIHIVENNLLCARYADKLTADEQKQIAQLQKRVYDRQEQIKANGFCTDIQESYPQGYADLEPYLAKLMKSEGIGIVWWAACIIAALVVGGLAAASYFIYRDLFEDSKEDVKWSDELTAKLMEKLTPEEFEQLKNETAGIVTKARIRAKLGSWGTILKVAAVLVAGAFAYKFFTNKQS